MKNAKGSVAARIRKERKQAGKEQKAFFGFLLGVQAQKFGVRRRLAWRILLASDLRKLKKKHGSKVAEVLGDTDGTDGQGGKK